jgi:hypothetical protein
VDSPGETEENYKYSNQGRRIPGRGVNPGTPEQKARMLGSVIISKDAQKPYFALFVPFYLGQLHIL